MHNNPWDYNCGNLDARNWGLQTLSRNMAKSRILLSHIDGFLAAILSNQDFISVISFTVVWKEPYIQLKDVGINPMMWTDSERPLCTGHDIVVSIPCTTAFTGHTQHWVTVMVLDFNIQMVSNLSYFFHKSKCKLPPALHNSHIHISISVNTYPSISLLSTLVTWIITA